MSEPGPKVAKWFGVVFDLLRQPLTALPQRFLLTRLAETFAVTGLSWDWRDADGRFGLLVQPTDALDPVAAASDLWSSGELCERHPLLIWFATTRDPRPWTVERVPTHRLDGLHRVYDRSTCVRQHVAAFLMSGQLPPAATRCAK